MSKLILIPVAVLITLMALSLLTELVMIGVNRRATQRQVLADYGIRLTAAQATDLSEPVKGSGVLLLGGNRKLKYDRKTGRADLVEYEYKEKKVAAR